MPVPRADASGHPKRVKRVVQAGLPAASSDSRSANGLEGARHLEPRQHRLVEQEKCPGKRALRVSEPESV